MAKPLLKEGRVLISLDGIREELFVRKGGLDQDHVAQLWIIYEAEKNGDRKGDSLPLIQVTTDWILVDGRHRLEAMRAAEMKEAVVEVVSTKGLDRCGVLLKAFEANLGGSLPPKTEDIRYTIKQMLANGWSEKRIEDSLPYPKSVAHRYVRDAYLERKKDSKIAAIHLLTKGYTLSASAKEVGITEAELKDALEGARKKNVVMASRKGNISSQFKVLNLALSRNLNKILEDYGTGQVTEQSVWEHLNHALRLAQGVARSIVDKKKRFEGEVEHRSSLSSSSKAVRELSQ
jgi:hypothetical protein